MGGGGEGLEARVCMCGWGVEMRRNWGGTGEEGD